MPLDYARIMGLTDTRTVAFTQRDTLLYALGVGFGGDPVDRRELPFVYEGAGLRTVPTQACVLAGGTELVLQSGVNLMMMVHGEQRMVLHAPLPVAGEVVATNRITALVDKGEGRGAIMIMQTDVADAAGNLYATVSSSAFCRGDGGFGGPRDGAPPVHVLPDRAPDRLVESVTRPDQALLYRLSGDSNPLHADPVIAVAAGFPRPILHGLCSYGIVCRQVLHHGCDYDPAKLAAFDARFSNPVYPGETIVTELWYEADTISFRSSVKERQLVVLNNGRAKLRA